MSVIRICVADFCTAGSLFDAVWILLESAEADHEFIEGFKVQRDHPVDGLSVIIMLFLIAVQGWYLDARQKYS